MTRARLVGIATGTLLATLVALSFAVPSANAGRLIATGHDVDDHCDEGDGPNEEQCGYMRTATKYVRAGAPQPNQKVLLLACSDELEEALDEAFTTRVRRRVVCPSEQTNTFRNLALTTNKFSAIIVGTSCNAGDDSLNQVEECDDPGADPQVATPDSFEINNRRGAIRKFFNKGGGIFVMAGQNNGDGDPSTGIDNFYNFVPIGLQGVAVNPPFCLTQRGINLGFHDQQCPNADRHNGTRDDINCCATHNSFAEPGPGPLKVAERDTEGFAETLVADAQIRGGGFVADNRKPKIGVRGLKRANTDDGCVADDFQLRIKVQDQSSLKRVVVKLNGRELKRTKRTSFRVTIPAERLLGGRHRIRIAAVDSQGNRATRTKRFRRCALAPAFTGRVG